MSIAKVAGSQQSSGVLGAASTTLVFAYTVTPVAGDTLKAYVRWDGADTITSVVDNRGNTWAVATQGNVSGVAAIGILHAFGVLALAPTITITFSAAVANRLVVVEEESSPTPISLDVAATASGSGTPPSAGSLVTTQAEDILVFCETNGNPASPTIVAPWTLDVYVNPGSANISVASRQVAAVGSVAATPYSAPSPAFGFAASAAAYKALHSHGPLLANRHNKLVLA